MSKGGTFKLNGYLVVLRNYHHHLMHYNVNYIKKKKKPTGKKCWKEFRECRERNQNTCALLVGLENGAVSHSGKHYGGFHMIGQSHFWVYTQKK